MDDQVLDNRDARRFELSIGNATAFASYRLEDDRVVLLHTEVPPEFSGRGVGSRLAEGAFALVRKDGRKVVTKCPFMASWVGRHPEYADIVVDG